MSITKQYPYSFTKLCEIAGFDKSKSNRFSEAIRSGKPNNFTKEEFDLIIQTFMQSNQEFILILAELRSKAMPSKKPK